MFGAAPPVFDGAAQPVGIIGLVSQQDRPGSQSAEQVRSLGAVAGLAGGEREFEGQSASIDQGVDLRRQAAARAAHTAIRVAFFEFAAC